MGNVKCTFITYTLATVLLIGCSGPPDANVASGVFATKPEWIFDANESIISTPAISDDTIVLRTEKHIYAVDASTRRIRWTADSPGSVFDTAAPLIMNGIVIVPEGSNPVAAFELSSGALLWRNCYLDLGQHDCSQAPSGLEVDDLQGSQGIITISDFSGDLTAYDLKSGTQLWRAGSPRRGGPSIAIENGTVYSDQFTAADTVQLWSADLKTGVPSWRLDVDDIINRLVAHNGVLYYLKGVGDNSHVIAMSENDQTILWQVPYHGGLVVHQDETDG